MNPAPGPSASNRKIVRPFRAGRYGDGLMVRGRICDCRFRIGVLAVPNATGQGLNPLPYLSAPV